MALLTGLARKIVMGNVALERRRELTWDFLNQIWVVTMFILS